MVRSKPLISYGCHDIVYKSKEGFYGLPKISISCKSARCSGQFDGRIKSSEKTYLPHELLYYNVDFIKKYGFNVFKDEKNTKYAPVVISARSSNSTIDVDDAIQLKLNDEFTESSYYVMSDINNQLKSLNSSSYSFSSYFFPNFLTLKNIKDVATNTFNDVLFIKSVVMFSFNIKPEDVGGYSYNLYNYSNADSEHVYAFYDGIGAKDYREVRLVKIAGYSEEIEC